MLQRFFISFLILLIPNLVNAQLLQVKYQATIWTDEEEEKLYSPSLVVTDPVTDEIYVVSRSRVIVYSPDLFPVAAIGKNRGVESPQGLAVDREGNLYISQAPLGQDNRYRISVLNACFQWVRDIYIEDVGLREDAFTPVRLAVDSQGTLYVSGSFYPGVVVLNKEGAIVDIIAPEEGGTKVTINDVNVDRNDRVYLVSADAGRVFVYDRDRNFIFKFGTKGGVFTKLARAIGMDMDPVSGRLYVLDYMRHTVIVYDPNGTFLFEFGGLGGADGWFQYPWDISLDSKGRVFVADTFNNRVEMFVPAGD